MHLHGNVLGCCQSAALATVAETAQGFKDARHLHICHSSYGLTISGRLLADRTANHFSVKLSLFMCMLAACSGSPPQCSTFSSITNSCKSAKQKLGLLYCNFQQADQKTLSHLYKALVLSRLDYGSCIHYPPSITLSDKLESIQGLQQNCARSDGQPPQLWI